MSLRRCGFMARRTLALWIGTLLSLASSILSTGAGNAQQDDAQPCTSEQRAQFIAGALKVAGPVKTSTGRTRSSLRHSRFARRLRVNRPGGPPRRSATLGRASCPKRTSRTWAALLRRQGSRGAWRRVVPRAVMSRTRPARRAYLRDGLTRGRPDRAAGDRWRHAGDRGVRPRADRRRSPGAKAVRLETARRVPRRCYAPGR